MELDLVGSGRTFLLAWGVALAAALALALLLAGVANAQTPTPPTEDGLGPCQPDYRLEILNDSANITPEQTVVRDTDGGFEAIIVTNCIIYAINYSIVDQNGEVVPRGVGTRYFHEQYDEIDYVPHSQYIEHVRYEVDYPDAETCQAQNTCAGDPVKDEQGIALQAEQQDAVTAYRVKFDYPNPIISRGDGQGILNFRGNRALDKNLDYTLNVEIVPFNGAPQNSFHKQALQIVAEASGNLWDKITRAFDVTMWVERGSNMVFRGWGGAIHKMMCEAILPFSDIPVDENGAYTAENEFASRKIVDPGTGEVRWEEYDYARDPRVPSGNNSCKVIGRKKKEVQREEVYNEALARYNEERARAGLPPMENEYEVARRYGRRVIDGVDPRQGRGRHAERGGARLLRPAARHACAEGDLR